MGKYGEKMLRYKLPNKSKKFDFVFNMFGSGMLSLLSVILLMTVSRTSGDKLAGIFTLCYSTAQMLNCIATFSLRDIQVTDAEHRFSFRDMTMFRTLSIVLMLISSVFFLLIKGFSGIKLTLALLLCVFMALIAVSDIFQGNMHYNGYLSLGGASLGFQCVLSAIVFAVTLIIFKSLTVSVCAMMAVLLLWILFFDLPFARNLGEIKPKFNFAKQKELLLLTLPIFISTFLNQYNLNTPKYAINDFLTDIDQSRYGYLIMPAFVINLLSTFVFRPQLVPLSNEWKNKKYSSFLKTVSKLFGWILAVTVVCLIGGYFFGIPVLNIIYSTDLSGYEYKFLILLAGGAASACSSLTIVLLAVIRKQKFALIAYGLAFAIAQFAPPLLVKNYGFLGAVLSYLTVTVSLFLFLITVFIICFLKNRKTPEDIADAKRQTK